MYRFTATWPYHTGQTVLIISRLLRADSFINTQINTTKNSKSTGTCVNCIIYIIGYAVWNHSNNIVEIKNQLSQHFSVRRSGGKYYDDHITTVNPRVNLCYANMNWAFVGHQRINTCIHRQNIQSRIRL